VLFKLQTRRSFTFPQVTKPFFRNQMLLVFCSVNGFLASSYFTLMLLDVVNISPTVQSLVKSVTQPGFQLGIVAYLFIVMVRGLLRHSSKA